MEVIRNALQHAEGRVEVLAGSDAEGVRFELPPRRRVFRARRM